MVLLWVVRELQIILTELKDARHQFLNFGVGADRMNALAKEAADAYNMKAKEVAKRCGMKARLITPGRILRQPSR